MAGVYRINKTGTSQPVWDRDNGASGTRVQIGSLMNREVYIPYSWDDYQMLVYFRNSAGSLVSGWVDTISAPWSLESSYGDYAYQKNGYDSYFICRSARNIYKADGTKWGTVAKDRLVSIGSYTDATAGSSMPYLMLIRKYETSAGVWSTINGSYGFVDSGITSNGSGYNSIQVYGSW